MRVVFLDCQYSPDFRDFRNRPYAFKDTMMPIPDWAYLESLPYKSPSPENCWHAAKYMAALIDGENCLFIGPPEMVGCERQGTVGNYNHKDMLKIKFGYSPAWRGGGHVYINTSNRTLDLWGSSYELGEALLSEEDLRAIEANLALSGYALLYKGRVIDPTPQPIRQVEPNTSEEPKPSGSVIVRVFQKIRGIISGGL